MMKEDEIDRPGFTVPSQPIPNYTSLLHMRNAAQIEDDKRDPPPEPEPLYACCGKNCRECEFFMDIPVKRGENGAGCRGCSSEGGECDIRLCCAGKGITSCASCGDFPCDTLKASSAEEDNDSDELMYLKSQADANAREKRSYIPAAVGAMCGFLIGLCIGLATGDIIQYIFLGLLVGTAMPFILGAAGKK